MVVVLILEKSRRRYRSVNHPLQEEECAVARAVDTD